MQIRLRLLSDATFGRGDGVAGLIDAEIEHDEYGLPYLRGRTLKGLLVEECANLLFALRGSPPGIVEKYEQAARNLFGHAGSSLDDNGIIHVGAAMLPEALREAIMRDIATNKLLPAEVLESLTAMRRQTAVDAETGVPRDTSLRSMRVLMRETQLTSKLTFSEDLTQEAGALLAASVLALRRAGTGRNRGRGKLKASLLDDNGEKIALEAFKHFKDSLSSETQEKVA